jgi:MFS family permease
MAEAVNGTPQLDDGRGGSVAGRERWTLTLISIGHFFSHYYGLVLPPLFPFLKAEFGVSYIELGFAMTAYGLLGGIMQSPIGFLVDRIGPHTVLLAGLGLNACAVLLMGLVGSYWILLALAVLAGLGNSVFHPADYAILNGAIRENKLGRAFSIHTFSGFLGGACAPVSVLVLAQWTDWQTALIATGVAGLVALAVMTWHRALLGSEIQRDASDAADETDSAEIQPTLSGVRLLLSAPVLLFLLFFILYGMSSGGLIAFTVSGLVELHGISLEQANTALSGHLFGVVGGILLAGAVVDRFPRHLLTAAIALLVAAAAVSLPLIVPSSGALLIGLMAVCGVGLGAVLPARDLMLRALTPPGEFGKVFGFVFVGYSIGLSVAPILFGWFLDNDQPKLVFLFAAVFAVLALLSTAAAQHQSNRNITNLAERKQQDRKTL